MKPFAAPLLLLCSLSLTGCQAPAPSGNSTVAGLETHYSPAENLETIDARVLRGARHTIDYCAYSLTDHLLAESLIAAAQRGVHVRLYLDQVQTAGEVSREEKKSAGSEEEETDNSSAMLVLRTLDRTPNVEIKVKRSKTLMHLKSYAVDGVTLRSGSANFSPTGEKRQDNDMVLTNDAASVQRFEKNFAILWARTDNEPLSELGHNASR
ncbi:MAG: phospholipase D-like domain-containing protein [Acidobacteriaceae bacterium]|nr:phospholipase D-like domain-containing protein [Acidobacteriaceae bacterium]